MAEVWEGHDEVLSRPVAIKVLRAHLAEDGVFLERFRREAVTAARLAHPGVVSTFDTGVDHGTAYIVMELVRGCTLRELLTEHGPLEPWLAVAITRQIADALAYAHQLGLVHRDIKPANVLLTDDEWGGLRAKVTDFGIAKASSGLGGDLTRTGIVLGTPKYLSPEQIRGKEPDARADLYSLGVVLFEMLTGSPPFVGPTDMATALAHLNDRVPRLSNRNRSVPPALERLDNDLLAKDPQHRVPSAAVLRQRLDACNVSPPLQAAGNGRRAGRRQRYAPMAALPHLPDFNGGAGRSASATSRASTTRVGTPPGTTAPTAAGPVTTPPVTTSTARTPAANGPATMPPPSAPPATARMATTQSVDGTVRSATASAAPSAGLPRPVVGPAPGPTASTSALQGTGARPGPPDVRPSRRRRRGPGIVVVGLVVAGAIVASVLFFGKQHRGGNGSPAGSSATGSVHQIASVQPFMIRGLPDDPAGLKYTIDGNPNTYWHTDQYSTAAFGNLYPGLGLAIELSGSTVLHHLTVTSTTTGWAAQTYTSATAVHPYQPVTAWGAPTETKVNIDGSATFTLDGRHGQWVLLWLTNLGQPSQTTSGYRYQVRIAELAVN